jgi:hypothetical protein
MDGYAFAGWRDLSLFLLALSALVSASCNFPRDPRGTLEGVQNATMRVGIVDNDRLTRMEEGAVPVEDLSAAETPIAAYEWQLPVDC